MALEFPPSSYYYARKREKEPSARDIRDDFLERKIMEVWESEKGRGVYGARKVWLEMKCAGNRGGAVHGRAADEEAGDLRCGELAEAAADDEAG